MRLVFLAPVCISISACAPVDPQLTTGPSGNTAYTMKCSGMGRTLEDCFVEAGKLCPAGYDVVNQSTGTRMVPINGALYASRDDSLTIECKS